MRTLPDSIHRPWLGQRGLWYSLSFVLMGLTTLTGTDAVGAADPLACPAMTADSVPALALPADLPDSFILRQSWEAYRQRFIQADGRVIDRESNDRSTSEGQAYAMLRAVLINDPDTFHRTYAWAETNLRRQDDAGQPLNTLWAWHWGQQEDGNWGILDPNFATDADIDAATALIFAARRWNCPAYLEAAREKLADIWADSTVTLPDGSRQLIPGPQVAFWPEPDTLILNPSYFAPYAFRLFAQVDPNHDWESLIDSGYALLEDAATTSAVGLPNDWIAYDPATATYRPLSPDRSIQSLYSFDAFRVWWRVALDAQWFGEPRAKQYLAQHLPPLIQRWRQTGQIPARIGLDGEPTVTYEATSQYAMLYPALLQVSPITALQMRQRKLTPTYRAGFWDNDSAYYTQNLAWFGLLPQQPPAALLNDVP